VDDGVIIVNEEQTRITVDDEPTATIKWTHLITYERKAIINDSVYLNLNYSVNKSPGIATPPLLNITGHDHILSLEMTCRPEDPRGSPRIWFAIGVAPCGLVLLQQHCSRKQAAFKLQKSIDELVIAEDGDRLKGGVVNNQILAEAKQANLIFYPFHLISFY